MRCTALLVVLLVSRAAAADCPRVAIWRAGEPVAEVCRADVPASLTILDLGDAWTPGVLAPGPDDAPAYRATYLALAQERFADAGLDGAWGARDRYLELYGIAPALAVVRARLADATRHACHAAAGALPDLPRLTEESATDARARLARAKRTKRTARVAGIRIVQAHLACDGLFETRPLDGGYTWQTSNAVERFQRGVMLLPTGIFDEETAAALRDDSRERDLRTALRVLRARVADATGLVEDGSAGAGEAGVLGRVLVPPATTRVRGHAPLADAAPDLLSVATESAARALGWRDADATLAFLARLAGGPALVAVELPPRAAYHAAMMALAVEIDRGDVWHDRAPRRRVAARRPALILYALDGGRRIPLARYPTTIGGWQHAYLDGAITTRWKESPVGPRIWRDLYIGPRWLPPASTPDRELVRRANGHYVVAREQLGPSYRAAFGMLAFVHLAAQQVRGETVYEDGGIRTHGTGNLASLAAGVSHGCHRLLGDHAVRLATFVLAHRTYIRRGETSTYYRRTLRVGEDVLPIAIDALGYRIELDPPLDVSVLPGRIH